MAINIEARVGTTLGSGSGLIASRNYGGTLRPTDTVGIIGRFTAFLRQVQAAVPRATANALRPTLDLAKIYCPKNTGALVYSGYIELVGRFNLSGNPVVAEIGFGKGGNPPYALIVHEMVEVYHKPPTRAKFLQRAWQETSKGVLSRIAAQLRV